jgi:mannose-1-phosphate guanylyltransferase
MKKYNVILSGGVGTRLWPLSREACPKQFLKIFNGRSLFQETVLRNQPHCDDAIMIGNQATRSLWNEQLAEMGCAIGQEIVESTPRNTAAAIAFAALSVDRDDLLFITPCDHQIGNPEEYEIAVQRAFELALEDKLVTFGILPRSPHTGYGYMQHEGEQVLAFREKPDAETARSFLSKGGYLWNSGMFCFRAGKFLEALGEWEPEILSSSKVALEKSVLNIVDKEASLHIPSKSVDYAVMEKSKDIAVVPSLFDWSDLGSFVALKEYMEGASDNGYLQNGNLVFSSKLNVSILGLQDIIVVDNEDVLLIASKEGVDTIKEEYETVTQQKPACK